MIWARDTEMHHLMSCSMSQGRFEQIPGRLGEKSPVKDLTELIEFNKRDSVELRYFNQNSGHR